MLRKLTVFSLSLASVLLLGALAAEAKPLQADLAVKKLVLVKKKKLYCLEGDIQNVSKKVPYKGHRIYVLEVWKKPKWVVLKKGPIPALAPLKHFPVEDCFRVKPPKGTKFRLRIIPTDGTPGDDQKVLIVP